MGKSPVAPSYGAVFAACLVWILPIIIAFMRGHPDVVAITAVDLLFGWSFIGWGIALVWSIKAFMRPEFYQGAGYSPPPPPPNAGGWSLPPASAQPPEPDYPPCPPPRTSGNTAIM
jgi:hypothetical protein